MTKSNQTTNIFYLFIIIMLLVSSFGCATSKSNSLKKLYEADEIREISKYVEIDVTTSNNKWNVSHKLEDSLEEELQERSYIVEQVSTDSTKMEIHIVNFDAGSQAARLTIGQIIPGVGGCSLDYNLEIVDKSKEKVLVKRKEKIRYSQFDPKLAQLDEYSVTDYLGGAESVTDRMVKMATEKILRSTKCWK